MIATGNALKPDLYIICAGMGSRMGGTIPKALVKITDKPNLTTTLQQIGHKFDKVFVVTNEENQGPWLEYFVALSKDYPELWNNVFNVAIKSGRGDGHAVLEGLRKSQALWQVSPDIVIAWGDVFFPHAEIIDELLSVEFLLEDFGYVPVQWEDNPYVTIVAQRDNTITHAEFSKYGELNEVGFHDQSVFRFKRDLLLHTLLDMDISLNKNGKYITQGNELSLLYVFHHVFNLFHHKIKILETEYPTLSFNTISEVEQIQKKIHEKWISETRVS